MKNGGVYYAFDGEICHEYMSLGVAITIFIAQQNNWQSILRKCDLAKAVMHNLFFQTTIARVLFYVQTDRKRKLSARFDDSHGSVTNFGISQHQIYYETRDSAITTDNLTRVAQVHILNQCPCSNQWCQASTSVTPEELITLYDKDINCYFLPPPPCFRIAQQRLAKANS